MADREESLQADQESCAGSASGLPLPPQIPVLPASVAQVAMARQAEAAMAAAGLAAAGAAYDTGWTPLGVECQLTPVKFIGLTRVTLP
eukprot:3017475-Rhodomonas_salina.1